ncbi:S-layer family protein, partial [Duganella sp. HH101]|uniref:beta strand repeat-containing protein n=1 Tax=Duganella sp. HH101 TaxID=1781066 RepID=UPI000AEBE41F
MPGSLGNANLLGGPDFAESGSLSNSLLLTGTLTSALASNNVTVNTANISGSDSGNISVLSAFAVPNNRSLTLTASNDISVNAALSLGSSSGLTLTAAHNIGLNAGLTLGPSSALTLTAGTDVALNTAMTLGSLSTASFTAGGDISLNAAMTGTGGSLTLHSGGSIAQHTSPSDALTISSISAIAANDIVLNNPSNTIGTASTLEATGGNLTLEAVNIYLGASTAGGTMTAIAHNGDVTVSGNLKSAGNMTLTSDKTNGIATVGNGVNLWSTGGNIAIQADNMGLNGTMTIGATAHGVTLLPNTDNVSIQVGSGAIDGASMLGLSQDELTGISLPNNGSLTITGHGTGTGNLTVVGNLDLTGGQNQGTLTLLSPGGNLLINNGAAVANTGVISLITQSNGDHRITNNGSVTSSANINLFSGKMTLDGGSLNGTSISLATTNPVDIGATGNPANTLALTNADLASAHYGAGNWVEVSNQNQVAAGDILVSQPLTYAGNLKLSATGSVAMQAAVTAGGLILNATNNITATDSVAVNGVFDLQAGNWSQVGSLPSFSAYDFRISGNGSFVRAADGDGSSAPYQIVDVYGLQGVGSLSRSSQSYVLNNDIDASETAHWNQTTPQSGIFSGFKPIGDLDHSYFGTFNGNHKTISGLNIYRPGSNHVGLFSVLGSGTIQDVKLTGATVEGGGYTGLLVGSINYGGNVSGVAIESDVTGNGAYVGGLAGYSSGSISNSYVIGNVTGKSANSTGKTGGLLGGLDTYGSLSATYSSGTGRSNTNDLIDALVGDGGNGGSIANSFFQTTGAPQVSIYAVGLSDTQIKQQASFTGFDFASTPVWRIYEGNTMPLLKAFLTPFSVDVNGPGYTKVYNGQAGAYNPAYTHPDVGGTIKYVGGINVGTYDTFTGLYSTKYDISYSGSAPLVVTPATLNVSLASRQYDNSTSGTLSGANLIGLFQSDTVTLNYGEGSSVHYLDKNAGVDKTVSLSGPPLGLSGASAGNYVLGSSIKGTITPRTASTWTGNSSNGLWSDAGNWALNIAPDGANVLAAVIGASAGTITYNGNGGDATLNTITVGSGSQLALTGGALTIASGGSKSYLTGATLNLNGGGLVLNGAMEATSLTLTNGVLSGTNSAANLTVNNLTQTNGSINMSGSLTVNSSGNIAVGTVRAQNGITLNAVESGSISQTGALTADSLHVMASSGITLTNTGNHVGAFYGSNGTGGIQLNNTVASGELHLGPLSSYSGNIVIDNHGGIRTEGAIVAGNGGGVSIAAHSPVTITDTITGNDITLSASTDIMLIGNSNLHANNTISLAAINDIVLGGHLTVDSPSGSISALATNGSISVGSGGIAGVNDR